MESLNEFTVENRRRIESAIETAENLTSGEIRVHIEDHCKEEVMDRASYIFDQLEMEKTKERNGILFYVAFLDHQLAILGDVGINMNVPDNFWEEIKDNLISNFKRENYTEGLVKGIIKAGEQLTKFFPSKGDKDVNELNNEITFSNDVE